MIAEIISTGSEICQGRYVDTNAWFLSQAVSLYGIRVLWRTTTVDDPDLIRDTLTRAAERADLVVMTGGLGPTEDDLTRQIVADLSGALLIEDAKVLEMITARFAKRGRPMNPSNRRQAMVPAGAVVLYNDWGTAPGLIVEAPRGGDRPPSVLVALPGPPREMKPMWTERAAPVLESKVGLRLQARILDIHTINRAESELNDRLQDLFAADPHVDLALLATPGQVDVRLTCRLADGAARDHAIEAMRAKVIERIGAEDIYGCDDETLESLVARALAERSMTLATAESCTGGLIAKQLTDISGSSAWFREGAITYTNASKNERLGVPIDLMATHGAVSEPVAIAMAEGMRERARTDWAIGVTGVAGPTGGTETKPVGMVCVAVAGPHGTQVNTTTYFGDRTMVRTQAAQRAMDMLRRQLDVCPER